MPSRISDFEFRFPYFYAILQTTILTYNQRWFWHAKSHTVNCDRRLISIKLNFKTKTITISIVGFSFSDSTKWSIIRDPFRVFSIVISLQLSRGDWMACQRIFVYCGGHECTYIAYWIKSIALEQLKIIKTSINFCDIRNWINCYILWCNRRKWIDESHSHFRVKASNIVTFFIQFLLLFIIC